ncbi:unnamed protein product [Rhodiola kirilowii]
MSRESSRVGDNSHNEEVEQVIRDMEGGLPRREEQIAQNGEIRGAAPGQLQQQPLQPPFQPQPYQPYPQYPPQPYQQYPPPLYQPYPPPPYQQYPPLPPPQYLPHQ